MLLQKYEDFNTIDCNFPWSNNVLINEMLMLLVEKLGIFVSNEIVNVQV